jgi:MFS family permease
MCGWQRCSSRHLRARAGRPSGWCARRLLRSTRGHGRLGCGRGGSVRRHRHGAFTSFVVVALGRGGSGRGPFSPAANAQMLMVVPEDQQAWATAQRASASWTGILVGGIVGGALVAAVGAPDAFLINAATFLVSVGCTLRISPKFPFVMQRFLAVSPIPAPTQADYRGNFGLAAAPTAPRSPRKPSTRVSGPVSDSSCANPRSDSRQGASASATWGPA